jgi:hypothetical protein
MENETHIEVKKQNKVLPMMAVLLVAAGLFMSQLVQLF